MENSVIKSVFRISSLSIRNFIFGVEDGLVSTVGFLSGVAAAGISRPTLLLTGAVLIFVEAFSMAVGSFLSEHAVEEYARHGEVSPRRSEWGALVMFGSYLIAGFIPLAPYVFLSARLAFFVSVALSLVALLLLGVFSARLFKISLLRKGFEMLIVGGVAIGVGIFVGKFFAKF